MQKAALVPSMVKPMHRCQSAQRYQSGVATLSQELKLQRLIQGDTGRESCNVAGMQARCDQLTQAGTCHPIAARMIDFVVRTYAIGQLRSEETEFHHFIG